MRGLTALECLYVPLYLPCGIWKAVDKGHNNSQTNTHTHTHTNTHTFTLLIITAARSLLESGAGMGDVGCTSSPHSPPAGALCLGGPHQYSLPWIWSHTHTRQQPLCSSCSRIEILGLSKELKALL